MAKVMLSRPAASENRGMRNKESGVRLPEAERDDVALRTRRTPGASRIRMKELPTFSRALAAMLSAGLPIVESLVALEAQLGVELYRKVAGRGRPPDAVW